MSKTTKNTSNVVAINSKPAKATKPARPTASQRFSKLLAAPDANGCELFLGAQMQNGYGMFSVGSVNIYSHRFSWEQANNQKIPAGKYVLHSLECKSRLCCAPQHLRIGTAAENSLDTIAAGRTIKGRKLNKRVMTTAEREQIISLSLSGMSGYAIAKRLDRSQVTISYQLRKHQSAVAAKLRANAENIINAANEFNKTLSAILDTPAKKAA